MAMPVQVVQSLVGAVRIDGNDSTGLSPGLKVEPIWRVVQWFKGRRPNLIAFLMKVNIMVCQIIGPAKSAWLNVAK
jgi:hypothetical protein